MLYIRQAMARVTRQESTGRTSRSAVGSALDVKLDAIAPTDSEDIVFSITKRAGELWCYGLLSVRIQSIGTPSSLLNPE